jgi:hypothetical protein
VLCVLCCRGTLTIDNFIMPFVGHAITLTQHTDQLAEVQQQSADILEAAAAEAAATAAGRRRTGVAGGAHTSSSSSSRGNELLPYLPLTSSCLADAGTKVRVRPSGGLLGAVRHRSATGDALVTNLQVYGSGESNYYYQLRRFAQDTRLLMDR